MDGNKTEQIHWLGGGRGGGGITISAEFQTLPVGTKPSTSQHRSSGGERRGKRKRSTIVLERTRKAHRQSDQHSVSKRRQLRQVPRDGLSTYGLPRAPRHAFRLN